MSNLQADCPSRRCSSLQEGPSPCKPQTRFDRRAPDTRLCCSIQCSSIEAPSVSGRHMIRSSTKSTLRRRRRRPTTTTMRVSSRTTNTMLRTSAVSPTPTPTPVTTTTTKATMTTTTTTTTTNTATSTTTSKAKFKATVPTTNHDCS